MTGFLGVVESRDDPEKRCRLKVRVLSKMEGIDIDAIPFAEPDVSMSGGDKTGSGSYSLPKEGSLVLIRYSDTDGDESHPYWCGVPIPSKQLIEFVGSDYKDAISLFFDTNMNTASVIMPSKGVLTWYKDASVLIRNDSTVLIKSKNQTIHVNSGISLGSEDKSNEPGVLGNKNENVLNEILNLIKTFITNVKTYSETQALVATANFITSPLSANLTALTASMESLDTLIIDLDKNIPKTKSEIVTLN